jgi:hypothetical protein
MAYWTRRLFALAAPLLLTGCLWGPGKFASDLIVRKDGSFVLDYRGEMVLNLPSDAVAAQGWSDDRARCFEGVSGLDVPPPDIESTATPSRKPRPCSPAEIAAQRSEFEKTQAEQGQQKEKQAQEFASIFGLPGIDDESSRAFASKLMKYAGWRSVTYRGHGVFDVDYHMVGSTRQDFVFPAVPDDELILPFIAIRRRADGSILVTAPALTGGAGPLVSRMRSASAGEVKSDVVSRAEGRFTVITDGQFLTNNSEDGPQPHAIGRQLYWNVSPSSTKVPETLIRL